MPETVIATDLLTPLGAYLRLREGARGRVPARVGRARAARSILVRRPRFAARVVRRGGVARRACGRVPRLRRDRPDRADGAAATRWARLPGEPLPRPGRPRALRSRARCCGDARRRGGRARGAAAGAAARDGHERPVAAVPRSRRASAAHRTSEGVHPRGRRVPGRRRTTRGPPHVRVAPRSSIARFDGSTRRRICFCSSSTTSRSSARRPRPW